MNATASSRQHPFRDDIAVRMRRRRFWRWALPVVFGGLIGGITVVTGEKTPSVSILGAFAGAGIILLLVGTFWWENRRFWTSVFRQSRGRTVYLDESDLVLRGPDASLQRIPLAGAIVHATRGANGIESLRVYPQNGGGAIRLIAFSDMDGLAHEIDSAIRKASPEGSDAREPSRHRWRSELADGAKRRLRSRFIRIAAIMVSTAVVLFAFAIPPSERLSVGLFMILFFAGIFCWSARTVWKRAIDPVRGSVAFVEAGMLVLERENVAANGTMFDLCIPGLHLREFRTKGILDELWLCHGGTIVLRLFGFEGLHGLRDEIAAVLASNYEPQPASPLTPLPAPRGRGAAAAHRGATFL